MSLADQCKCMHSEENPSLKADKDRLKLVKNQAVQTKTLWVVGYERTHSPIILPHPKNLNQMVHIVEILMRNILQANPCLMMRWKMHAFIHFMKSWMLYLKSIIIVLGAPYMIHIVKHLMRNLNIWNLQSNQASTLQDLQELTSLYLYSFDFLQSVVACLVLLSFYHLGST